MGELVVTTYDWVPPPPRGYVRDLRVRWALEEAGLAYRVASTPFKDRQPEHFAHQPFGQVPWLTDGDLSIFESGAILMYLGEKSAKLLPTDLKHRAEATEWVFGALNSMEMVTVPWSFLKFSNLTGDEAFKQLDGWLGKRLEFLEPVLAKREWLAGGFSIADILMADVLRLLERLERLKDFPQACAYIARAIARPAFVKAHADQMAHFEKADAARA